MFTLKPVKEIPDEEVVNAIEELLVQAKEGKLQSLALCVLYQGGDSGSAWAGMNKDNIRILGELELLKRDIQDCLIDLRIEMEE